MLKDVASVGQAKEEDSQRLKLSERSNVRDGLS